MKLIAMHHEAACAGGSRPAVRVIGSARPTVRDRQCASYMESSSPGLPSREQYATRKTGLLSRSRDGIRERLPQPRAEPHRSPNGWVIFTPAPPHWYQTSRYPGGVLLGDSHPDIALPDSRQPRQRPTRHRWAAPDLRLTRHRQAAPRPVQTRAARPVPHPVQVGTAQAGSSPGTRHAPRQACRQLNRTPHGSAHVLHRVR